MKHQKWVTVSFVIVLLLGWGVIFWQKGEDPSLDGRFPASSPSNFHSLSDKIFLSLSPSVQKFGPVLNDDAEDRNNDQYMRRIAGIILQEANKLMEDHLKAIDALRGENKRHDQRLKNIPQEISSLKKDLSHKSRQLGSIHQRLEKLEAEDGEQNASAVKLYKQESILEDQIHQLREKITERRKEVDEHADAIQDNNDKLQTLYRDYYRFMALALIVPYHEGRLVHFRKYDECSTYSNNFQKLKNVLRQGSPEHRAYLVYREHQNNGKSPSRSMNNSQYRRARSYIHAHKTLDFVQKSFGEGIIPSCSTLAGKEKLTQILSSYANIDFGIGQINATYHKPFYQSGDFFNVRKTLRYAHNYLFDGKGYKEGVRGFLGINDGYKGRDYSCLETQNFGDHVDNRDFIAGAWAGMYNMGNIRESSVCRPMNSMKCLNFIFDDIRQKEEESKYYRGYSNATYRALQNYSTVDDRLSPENRKCRYKVNDYGFYRSMRKVITTNESPFQKFLPEGTLERKAIKQIFQNFRKEIQDKALPRGRQLSTDHYTYPNYKEQVSERDYDKVLSHEDSHIELRRPEPTIPETEQEDNERETEDSVQENESGREEDESESQNLRDVADHESMPRKEAAKFYYVVNAWNANIRPEPIINNDVCANTRFAPRPPVTVEVLGERNGFYKIDVYDVEHMMLKGAPEICQSGPMYIYKTLVDKIHLPKIGENMMRAKWAASLRDGPGKSYSEIDTVTRGEKVKIVDEKVYQGKYKWYKMILPTGKVGWSYHLNFEEVN